MELVLLVILIISVALVITILRIVSQAVGNLFDWLIYTFGNDEAVKRLKERWEMDDGTKPR